MKKSIKKAYLNGDPTLSPFYQYNPNQPDFLQIIKDKSSQEINRDILVDSISIQYQNLSSSETTNRNISDLRKENTFSICTGHQLCLFGGPMYMIYKILTAIKLSVALNIKHPEYQFVPIFWMASEDHDAEEINHFFSDYHELVKYTGHFRGAVGRHLLEDTISDVKEKLPEFYQNFFDSGIQYAGAFRQFIHALFDRFGLIILDADSPELKTQFSQVIKNELTKKSAATIVGESNKKLKDAGFSIQANSRPINLFHLGEDRELILPKEDDYQLKESGRIIERNKIVELVGTHPESFSPNVLLRPLYQECILPNLVTIGGWGEIGYWLELKTLFESYKINFPLLLPRMSAGLVHPEQDSILKNLDLNAKDMDRSLHDLLNQVVAKFLDQNLLSEAQINNIPALITLQNFIVQKEKSLESILKSEESRDKKYVEKLLKKVRKSFRELNIEKFTKTEEIKHSIQPDNSIQERTLNVISFSKENPEQLIDVLFEKCDPLNFEKQWIKLP